MSKDRAAASLGKRGGLRTKETQGADHYKKIVGKRWDKAKGKICLRCDKHIDVINKAKLPCVVYVKVKKTYKNHMFVKQYGKK